MAGGRRRRFTEKRSIFSQRETFVTFCYFFVTLFHLFILVAGNPASCLSPKMDITDCYSQFKKKEFLQKYVPELSRLLAGKTQGQNIWSQVNVPKNWPIELKWKNPTSSPKDSMSELELKFDWLKAETKTQNVLSERQLEIFDHYDNKDFEKVITFIEVENILKDLKKINECLMCNEKLVLNINKLCPNKATEIAFELKTLSERFDSNKSFDVHSDQIEVRSSDNNILFLQDDITATVKIRSKHNRASLSHDVEYKIDSYRAKDEQTEFENYFQENANFEPKNNLTLNKNTAVRKRKNTDESLLEGFISSKRSPQELSSNSFQFSCSQSPTMSRSGSVETNTDSVYENVELEISGIDNIELNNIEDPQFHLDNEALSYNMNTASTKGVDRELEFSGDHIFNFYKEAPNDCINNVNHTSSDQKSASLATLSDDNTEEETSNDDITSDPTCPNLDIENDDLNYDEIELADYWQLFWQLGNSTESALDQIEDMLL